MEQAHTQPASPNPRTAHRSSMRRQGEARRYAFACNNCKARKVKCSGDQPVCRACQRANVDCTWQTPSTDKQLQEASSRIRQLEAALQQVHDQEERRASSDASRSHGTATSPSTITSPAVNTDLTTRSSLWFQVGVGDDGAVTYNGPTSRFHAGPLEDRAIEEERHRTSRAQTPDHVKARKRAAHAEAVASQHNLLNNLSGPLIHSRPILESLGVDTNVCTALLEIYWTWLQPLHNCVYRPSFLMDMAFGGSYYSDFLLLSIFALSARHLSEFDRDFFHLQKGEHFLIKAKELLIEEMSVIKPRITTIQGLLILGGRQCAMGKSSEGWLYTGMALRMLEDIGLHLHIDDSKLVELEHLTPVELETRKRLYNSAYIWDKTISLALGRPPSLTQYPHPPGDILDHHDDSQEWHPVYAPEIGEHYLPTPSCNTVTFCAHSELHKVTTDMISLFAHAANAGGFAEGVRSLDARFATWYMELPEKLRIDDASVLQQSPPPHIVSLNVLYHALLVLLHRPNLGSQIPSIRVHNTDICIAHSKSIHSIFSLYEKTFPYRLMTYQVSYCLFTAATIEAYVMKNLESDTASQAAQRLGTFMRALHHETKHTPGIGRSLDTIRRRLASWTPRTSSHEHGRSLITDSSSNDAQHGASGGEINRSTEPIAVRPPDPTDDVNPDSSGSANANDPVLPSQDFVSNAHTSSGCFYAGQDIRGSLNFGDFMDTGAGFHPDAFPWSVTDLLMAENNSEPFWAPTQPWDWNRQ